MQCKTITSQPLNLTHKKTRRNHLPNYPRSNTFMQEPNHACHH